jgi:hypothetical protein
MRHRTKNNTVFKIILEPSVKASLNVHITRKENPVSTPGLSKFNTRIPEGDVYQEPFHFLLHLSPDRLSYSLIIILPSTQTLIKMIQRS